MKRDELDETVDRVVREADARLFGSSERLTALLEKWSDAARAAAAAARKARKGGGNTKKAGAFAYWRAGGTGGRLDKKRSKKSEHADFERPEYSAFQRAKHDASWKRKNPSGYAAHQRARRSGGFF